MYKRILVPTDGSATAVEATKVAISLAKCFGAAEVVALFIGPGRIEDPMQYIEQEQLEGWIMTQVDAGAALPGLYPPNEDNKARYQAWVKLQNAKP